MSTKIGGPPLVSDPAATESYYRQLFGSADSGFLPIWESQSKHTRWFRVTQLDDAAETSCQLADQGLDVYHGMGLHPQPLGPARRGEAAGVCALPGLYMDLDIKGPGHTETALPESIDDVLVLLADFPLPPSLLNFSGGGVHAHWLFRELFTIETEADRARIASALKQLQAEIRRLARQSGYKLDSTADLARLLRAAGTINNKSEPVLVRMLKDSGERYLLEEIEDVLPDDEPAGRDAPPKEGRRAAFDPIRDGCAFMRHVVEDAATLPEPDWHSGMTIVSLCANGEELAHQISAPYQGYTRGETQKMVDRAVAANKPIRCTTIESRHGDDWCARCEHRGQITSPIQLGYPPIMHPGRNGPSPRTDDGIDAQRTTSYSVYSWDELLNLELPPERPLIAELLGENTGAIIGGAPSVGKSWLVVEAARAVASGTPFLGEFLTTQHGVLVVDEESHLRGIIQRARKFDRAHSLGRGLPLHFAVGLGIRFDLETAVSQLEDLLRQYRPGLVIADSLTRVHTANENSASEMAQVFLSVKRLMRDYGCTVLFTDHVRKRSLINEPEEMLRGSTEKRAWADSIFAVESDAQDRNHIIVTHTKSRHGERHDPFGVWLEIDNTEGTARLRYGGAVTESQASKANDLLAAIHSLHEQLGPDGADATTIAAWMNCSPDTVQRHAGKLVDAGILAKRPVASGQPGRPKSVYDVEGGRS